MFIIYCGHGLHPYYHQTDAVLRLQPFVLALRIIGEVCIYYRHKWNRLSIEAPVQCQVRNCRYHPSISVFVTFPVGFCWVKGWVSIARRNSRDWRSSGSSQSRRQGPQHRTLARKLRQILPFHWKRLRFLWVLLKLSLQCILQKHVNMLKLYPYCRYWRMEGSEMLKLNGDLKQPIVIVTG